MADIIIDTYKLNQYAQRIAAVNSRISRLDRRLDSLYFRIGLLDLFNLKQADALTCYSWRLAQCQSYLQQTANDFESAENTILREDPLTYKANIVGILDPLINPNSIDIQNLINLNDIDNGFANFGDAIKSQIMHFPEDIKDAGDALAWLENLYGKAPDWLTHGIEVFVSSSLKNAYILTSGIFQGDLTGKEIWDAAKSILSKNTKLAVIAETMSYAFENANEGNKEMEEEIIAQLKEGDILGAVFDGAEGFVDNIIGGSIEVLGDVVGGTVDDKLGKMRVVKHINDFAEYGTGLLGWNEGDGYSVGGLIGGAAEKISDGIDVATDFVTDVTDVVTDTVTGGIKTGVKWVTSWFD